MLEAHVVSGDWTAGGAKASEPLSPAVHSTSRRDHGAPYWANPRSARVFPSCPGLGRNGQATVGAVTYYAPWGNLAIFYKDFGYAKGLVSLGVVERGLKELATLSGSSTVVIDRIETSTEKRLEDSEKRLED